MDILRGGGLFTITGSSGPKKTVGNYVIIIFYFPSAARCPSLREDGFSLARERPEVRTHSSPSLPLLRQEVKEGMSLSSDGLEVTSVPRHTKFQDSPSNARSIEEILFLARTFGKQLVRMSEKQSVRKGM